MAGKRGRPSIYTPEIADEICRRLADGESLLAISRDENMPAESAVRAWALDDREGFYAKYARARELQAERWADEINEIGDDARNDWMAGQHGPVPDHEHISRSKLRCDNRKWLLSKLLPKKFGDKLAIGGDQQAGPIVFAWAEEPAKIGE